MSMQARKKKAKAQIMANEPDKILGLLLVLFRLRHGLSQSAIAEVLGLQQSAVSRVEAGTQSVTITHLLKLHKKYGDSNFLFVNVDSNKIFGVEEELMKTIRESITTEKDNKKLQIK